MCSEKAYKNSAKNRCFVSNDKEENGNTCIHGTGWIDDPSKCVFKLMILEATQKKELSMYMYMILEISFMKFEIKNQKTI